MRKVKGVKRYARQFISGVDIAEVPRAIEQLSTISRLMQKDRNFKNLMISPTFDEDERRKAIEFVSKKIGASERVVEYIKYLSDSKVISALSDIVDCISALYLDMKKRTKAIVTSPVGISKDYEKRLAASLKQITGRDIDMEFVIDTSLLGGICVKVGSTMYDSSLKGQLKLLKNKLTA